jgi:hypothetical protein
MSIAASSWRSSGLRGRRNALHDSVLFDQPIDVRAEHELEVRIALCFRDEKLEEARSSR